MKRFTHPTQEHTLIQRKDGSTYSKYWLFFRSAISLEVDSKAWTGDNSFALSFPQKKVVQTANAANLTQKSSRKGRSLFNL